MQTVSLIVVGKLKEGYLRDGCAEYQKRLSGQCKLTVFECPESRLPGNPSQKEIAGGMESEGESIRAKISPGYTIALCVEGEQCSSEELAGRLQKLGVGGISHLNLIIGGSYGLAPSVKQAADFRLSISQMTLPHQLCRLVLLEQLYRAFSINANSKYHK